MLDSLSYSFTSISFLSFSRTRSHVYTTTGYSRKRDHILLLCFYAKTFTISKIKRNLHWTR